MSEPAWFWIYKGIVGNVVIVGFAKQKHNIINSHKNTYLTFEDIELYETRSVLV